MLLISEDMIELMPFHGYTIEAKHILTGVKIFVLCIVTRFLGYSINIFSFYLMFSYIALVFQHHAKLYLLYG